MRHIFIINPAAGTGIDKELKKALEEMNGDITVYETQYSGDGRRFVSEYCLGCKEEKMRFYACGGSGTIQEVAEGIMGCDNADFTCFPCGTSNDFIKCFGGNERFRNVGRLMLSQTEPIDIISMNDRIAVNMVHFGFDSYVARTMQQVKDKVLIGGKNSYSYGVFKALFRARKNRAKIYADGELLNPDGEFMLCTAANGQYAGGQFFCCPRSKYNDGIIDLCIVKPISLTRFLKLMPSYASGKYLDDPEFQDIITYRRCEKVEMKAEEKIAISLDGEIVETKEFVSEILPSALRFAVPPEMS